MERKRNKRIKKKRKNYFHHDEKLRARNSEGEKYLPFLFSLSHPNTRPMTEVAPKAAQWETEEPYLFWQEVALENHENCLLKLHTVLLVTSKCCQGSLDQYSASSEGQCSLGRGVGWDLWWCLEGLSGGTEDVQGLKAMPPSPQVSWDSMIPWWPAAGLGPQRAGSGSGGKTKL